MKWPPQLTLRLSTYHVFVMECKRSEMLGEENNNAGFGQTTPSRHHRADVSSASLLSNSSETNPPPSSKTATDGGLPASAYRQGMTLVQFNTRYRYEPLRQSLGAHIQTLCKPCRPSRRCFIEGILGLFPFIRIMKGYSIRSDLLGDLVAGLTVGVMVIPQGLAYGMLANLPATYGLYCSYFAVIVYFFLGTSRQMALGTMAITSLMIGNVVSEFKPMCDSLADTANKMAAESVNMTYTDDPFNSTETAQNYNSDCIVGVAMSCSMLVGIIQILFGVFRMGFVTDYLGDPLTKAFITGASVHIITSQLKHVFQVKLTSYRGPLKIVYIYIDLFCKISSVNIASLCTTLLCMLLIYSSQKWISPPFKKRFKVPLPIELLIIVITTIISHFGCFASPDVFAMVTVGHVPTGLPVPTFPNLSYMRSMFADAFSIAIISLAINISMAKRFTKKHGYTLDYNQELLAYGLTNFISSIFNGFVSAASVSRSVIQDQLGGVTQMAGLISSGLLTVVILAMGPLFTSLPNCVLAAIILVNLRNVLMQIFELPHFYKVAFYDMLIWLVMFFAVVLTDVDYGLLIGVSFSLLIIVFKTQRPHSSLLGRLDKTGFYEDVATYKSAQELSGIRIFQFSCALYYANAEHFMRQLSEKTGCDPIKLAKLGDKRTALAARQLRKHKRIKQNGNNEGKKTTQSSLGALALTVQESKEELAMSADSPQEIDEDCLETVVINASTHELKKIESSNGGVLDPECNVQDIILDCSRINTLDGTGLDTIKTVMKDYAEVGVRVSLAACRNEVYELLVLEGAFKSLKRDVVFVTVHDAVVYITRLKEEF